MDASIGQDNTGTYIEIYVDDDGGSGYGDNPRVGRYYGSREELAALDPRQVKLYPLCSDAGRPDPFDMACERRFD